MKKSNIFLGVALFAIVLFCVETASAQNKTTQCEQFYKDAKSAYDKGDYEVALLFFNRCKKEGCANADFQIYIDVCNMKLGKKGDVTTTDNGVEIDGVVWATCNVDVPGKFVDKPQYYGKLYTWKEAQNVCPKGWRLPTNKEFESLMNSGTSICSELNKVRGRYFGMSDKIFMPFAGWMWNKAPYEIDLTGNYWSSTEDNRYDEYVWRLSFHCGLTGMISDYEKNFLSVRCVAE